MNKKKEMVQKKLMDYEKHVMPNKMIPFIFHLNIRSEHMLPYRNWHENVEFLRIIKGSGSVLCDAHHVEVTAGDVVAINSDSFHDIITDDYIEYHCLIVDSSFCHSNGIPVSDLRFQNRVLDEEAVRRFDEVAMLFEQRAKPCTFFETKLRIAVLHFVTYMAEFYQDYQTEDGFDNFSQHIKQAITYIKYHYSENITVEDILDHVGFSRAYFSREFKRNTGVSMVTYLNQVRCRQAEILLEENEYSISQIAALCGFHNASYFTKTYKRIMGVLPSRSTVEKRIQ